MESGTPEAIESRRIARWKMMSPDERLEALAKLRREVLGHDAERLERTYRRVEVPRR